MNGGFGPLPPAILAQSQPIEMAFSKLKALLQAAEPRNKEALWRTIGALLDRFPPAQCRNMLRHAGYLRSG